MRLSPSGSTFMVVTSQTSGCTTLSAGLHGTSNLTIARWLMHSTLVLSTAAAQPTTFSRISVEQGLPSAYVTTVYQDSKGFMWFGTDAGLCRYDGHAVKVFNSNPADSTSLGGNGIWSLCEDRDANLWVGTYNGGLNRLHLKKETITRIGTTSLLPSELNAAPIKALLVDRNNVLWVGTFGAGLAALNLSTQSVHHYLHDSLDDGSIPDNTIFCILEDFSGALWIGTANGLCTFDPLRQHLRRYVHDPHDPRTLSNNVVVTVFEDHRHRLWVGTKKGLNVLDRASGMFTRFDAAPSTGVNNPSVYAIGEHCTRFDTSLWIGTDGEGLMRYNESTNSFTLFTSVVDEPTSISDNHINAMFTDRTGALWIGTLQGGVNKIDTQRKRVRNWRFDAHARNSLSKGPVYSLAQDSLGNIWIGTYTGGLCRYDQRTGTFQRYDRASAHSLPGNDIPALLTDRSGHLWVGTTSAGLLKFDAQTERFLPFSTIKSNQRRLSGVAIDEIFEDEERKLWIGTAGGGLNMYDRKTDVLVRFLPDPSNPRSISHTRVTVIRESRGKLWVGTEGGGLNMMDRTTREFMHFRFHATDTNSLSNDLVYAIHEDRNGMLWVGTSNGLNSFDPRTGKFRRYFVRDGLRSDYVKGILEDSRGHLWIITARGVSRMSSDRRSIVNFGHRDGLINIGFNDAFFLSSRGYIYAGGSEGVDIFHPDSLVEDVGTPPVVLTEFTVYNTPYTLPDAIPFTTEISALEWNQNFFSITFAVLDFTNPERNLYAYRMTKEGEPEWVSSGTTRFANFTNLDHGSYLFTATGSNSNGVWNPSGVSLRITIKPPFWKTWWFMGLVVVALIGTLAVIYNVRVSHLLNIERLCVRIASDLHDDVGSSLSAIALMTDMVGRKLPEGTVERERLATATYVARTTADALKDIVWLITPEHETIEDMVLRMRDAASKLLLNIHHTFDADEKGLSRMLDMEFRRNVILIYKEILNNITKHAHATKVEITLRNVDDMLLLRVCDDGKGFDEATVKRGNGLNTLRLRAESIGGTINVLSAPGKGTTIELRAKIP